MLDNVTADADKRFYQQALNEGKMSSTTIENIPHEIMVAIFCYLSLEELHTCSRVCKRWQKVSLDHSLWKKRTYTPSFHESEHKVISTLRQSNMLRNIDFRERSQFTSFYLVEKICELCPNIHKLVFDSQTSPSNELMYKLLVDLHELESFEVVLDCYDYKYFVDGLCQSKNLKYLSLNIDSYIYPPGLLKPFVDHCSLLRYFKLTLTFPHSNEDLGNVVSDLKESLTNFHLSLNDVSEQTKDIFNHFTKLQELHIRYYGDNVVDISLLGYIKALKSFSLRYFKSSFNLPALFKINNWTQLVQLNLICMNQISPLSWLNIFKCVPNLQEFDVKGVAMSNEGIGFLFTCCPNLVHLRVLSNLLTDSGLKNLSKCSKLKSLDLSQSNSLTCKCLHQVVKCYRLTNLNLSWNNWLTDQGIQILLQCSNLTVLRVDFCSQLRDLVFLQIPTNLKHLRVLYIRRNPDWYIIPDKYLCDLLKQMPNLKVISQYY